MTTEQYKPHKPPWEDMDEQAFPQSNNMDKILEFPEIRVDKPGDILKVDVGGFLARCNFKDDKEVSYHLELSYMCIEANDLYHLKMVLAAAQAKLGIKAIGLTSKKEMGTNLLTPALTRDQLGIKLPKDTKDEVYSGGDINEKNKKDDNLKTEL